MTWIRSQVQFLSGPVFLPMKKSRAHATFEKYRFRPYPAQSKGLFKLEKAKLQSLLGSSASVFHVGSTAVPGLGGKGILDVLIALPKKRRQGAARILERGGYARKKTTKHPTRIFFTKNIFVGGKVRRIHLHVTHKGSRVERSMLALCRYLCAYPAEARRYADLKRTAAKRAKGRGSAYRATKNRYMSKLTKKASKENLYKP